MRASRQVRSDKLSAAAASGVASVVPKLAQLTRPSMKARGQQQEAEGERAEAPAQTGRGLTTGRPA